MQFAIVKNRKIWFIFSGLLVLGSILALIFIPPKFGIDFTGGSLLEIQYKGARPEVDSLRATLADDKYTDVVVQTVGDKGMLMRMSSIDETAHQQLLKYL